MTWFCLATVFIVCASCGWRVEAFSDYGAAGELHDAGTSLNHADAKSHCQAMSARLPIFNSEEALNGFSQFMSDNFGDSSVRLGLTYDNVKKKFFWEDGQELGGYTNWQQGHPVLNTDCVQIFYPSNKWMSIDCTDTRRVVCQKVPLTPKCAPGLVAGYKKYLDTSGQGATTLGSIPLGANPTHSCAFACAKNADCQGFNVNAKSQDRKKRFQNQCSLLVSVESMVAQSGIDFWSAYCQGQ